MRIILPLFFASLLASHPLFGNENPTSEEDSVRDLGDASRFEFHICQAFNSDGFIVAMQMGRDEALARIKTWEICYRHKLDCYQVQCYEQF